MKIVARGFVLWGALTLASVSPSAAQPPLPLDPTAVFRTPVPYLDGLVAGGGRRVLGPASPAVPGLVSAPAYVVGPTVTPTTSVPEAEEHIAVAPSDARTLISVVSDFAQLGFNMTKYAVSADNGATWVESYVPTDPVYGFLATGDGYYWLANSDPVVAVDTRGNVYLVDLYLDVFDNGNGLYVSVATLDSGVGFTVAGTLPVVSNPQPFTILLEDKPWIAVDNGNNPATVGTVYVSWTHFVGSSGWIVVSSSADQGATWTAPLRISPPAQDGAVQGSAVAVGPDGEVYVVYELSFAGAQRQHLLAKSGDGGRAFSTPRPITPLFNDLAFSSTYRKNSFAALAVSPVNGNVYVVYADEPNATVGAEVEFVMSSDGGMTFASPVVINDTSMGEQFMPALTVDAMGTIHVSWFDTRRSPSSTARYDIFATYSADNGGTFATNARATASLVDAGAATFIGDYAGIAAAGGWAHPVWTRGGSNDGPLQTATLTLP